MAPGSGRVPGDSGGGHVTPPALSQIIPDRPAAVWDTLVPDTVAGFYLSHAWLTAMGAAWDHRSRTWPVHDANGQLTGLVPAYTTTTRVYNPRYDLGRLFGLSANDSAWYPQTIIGACAGYANTPLVADLAAIPAWAQAASAAASDDSGSAA